ncbi:MAG: hypothetical protein EXR05_07290 [Acetobacteraceae bacterium]|nr:hypothetical protein [Acetobacteraceae bacterium]MSP30247.1 hypothetical protein [Acetobacteraceae bacterium]
MATESEGHSTAPVCAALLATGRPDAILAFPDGNRTSDAAALTVGCDRLSFVHIARLLRIVAGDRELQAIYLTQEVFGQTLSFY